MDWEDYDQSMIPDDQEEAEQLMADMGEERSDSDDGDDVKDSEVGSDQDAEGEDDDEDYGLSGAGHGLWRPPGMCLSLVRNTF